jgi:proline iminopeptidase
VADLDRLRTHLGLDGVVVFGHSWGGMLAMAYAAAHPSHVRALVLSGSGGVSLAFFGRYAHAMRTRLRPEDVRALAAWADSLAAGVDPARVARARRRIRAALYLHDRAHLPTLVAEALDPAPMNRTVFDGMMRDLHRRGYDLRPRLGAFEGPALVVQGRHDAVGLGTARRIARHLAGARLRLLDDCAHYPWIETPAVYYDAVLGFLHRVE